MLDSGNARWDPRPRSEIEFGGGKGDRTARLPDKAGRFLVGRKSGGGGKGDRTPDLLHAMQALSQLSYAPTLETP
jgi:hypothetical protein